MDGAPQAQISLTKGPGAACNQNAIQQHDEKRRGRAQGMVSSRCSAPVLGGEEPTIPSPMQPPPRCLAQAGPPAQGARVLITFLC